MEQRRNRVVVDHFLITVAAMQPDLRLDQLDVLG
jgi:hypothetical protein